MQSKWDVWTNADSTEKACIVLKWFVERLGREVADLRIEPYPKTGGHVAHFDVELESSNWNDQVVELISLGEVVGQSWTMSGSVSLDPSAWCNRPTISGVTSIQWMLLKT